MELKSVITLVRPSQWIKNIVLFGALIFSREFTNIDHTLTTLYAFLIFCLLSSVIYIVNDISDRESDRSHPEKRKRPIASGRLSVGAAATLAVVGGLIGILLSMMMPVDFVYFVVAFLVFNFLYSWMLKRVVIIDVMAIAISFVIRAVAGAAAIGVPFSPWLIVCTFLLALFIGFGKRRHEVVTLKGNAADHRITLGKYSTYLLDQLIGVVTASTVVAYAFYTVSPEVKTKLGVERLELTIPFVIYGIFRYLYLIHQEEQGGFPSKLLVSDAPTLINIVLWFLSVLAIFLWFGV
ncbi:MAG: decaprenyl-phosphate phosphoribosyltransferase [candidate division Zixibacteria bacterium]|nr:decaprenyl-phosphate phosphoribosyltransferase [candidate division Zixibacteria bacterium]